MRYLQINDETMTLENLMNEYATLANEGNKWNRTYMEIKVGDREEDEFYFVYSIWAKMPGVTEEQYVAEARAKGYCDSFTYGSVNTVKYTTGRYAYKADDRTRHYNTEEAMDKRVRNLFKQVLKADRSKVRIVVGK